MSRKWNRFLSFLLAIALVVTTFGSDFASANVYAADGEEGIPAVEQQAEPESQPEIFEEIPEVTPEEPTEAPKEEVTVDVSTEATSVAAVEEGSAGQSVTEENADAANNESAAIASTESADEASKEASTEDAATDASSEEDAAAEASSEDAAAEASSEEEEEVVEEKVVEKIFQASAQIDGIMIELYADAGVLPADAELEVNRVSSAKEEQITDVFDEKYSEAEEVETISFDIKIWSPELKQYVQPEDGTVEVRFSEISQAANDNSDLAVYHVSDDMNSIEQVASAGDTDTEVSFNAEHFSIYTIVIAYYVWFVEIGDFTFNALLVDDSGKALPGSVTIRGKDSHANDTFSAESMAPNVAGYRYVKATYNNNDFTDFHADQFHVLHAYNRNKDLGSITGDNQVRFVYKFAGYQTSDHIDLGFKKDDYDNYYRKAVVTASISSINNGKEIEMSRIGLDSEIGSYEYRLNLNGKTVKYTDKVVFKVYYQGKTYKMECSSEDNLAANLRCYEEHKNIQDEFGFDYLATFTGDFTEEKKDVYIAVYATDGTRSKTVNPNLASTLDLDFVQEYDGYYPIGVITMDESFFRGKSDNFIKTPADWNTVVRAFSETFTTQYNNGKNLNNTVYKNLQYVDVEYGYGSSSYHTALFDWNRWSRTISNVDGKDFQYHLDLRFSTRTVKYVGVYPNGQTTDLASSVVLRSSQVELPDPSAYEGKIPEHYQVEGHYRDVTCRTEFAKNTYPVYWNTTIYVKLVESLADAKYKVEYYYQNNQGGYPDTTPYSSELRTAQNVPTTGSTINIDESDKNSAKAGYSYDAAASASTISGTILPSNTSENPYTLKVYFSRNISGVVATITAPSDSKPYDGNPLTTEGAAPAAFKVEDSDGNELTGYTVEVTYDGTITDYGTVANNIASYIIKNESGEEYYYEVSGHNNSVDGTGKVTDPEATITQINIIPGNLSVSKIALTINIPDAEKVYDGTFYAAEDYVKKYTVTTNNENIKVKDVTVEIPKTIITVDSSTGDDEIGITNTFKLSIKKAGTEEETEISAADIAKNIDLTIDNGNLTITKRPVIILSDSKTGTADGKPFSAPDAKVIFPENVECYDFVAGEKAEWYDFTVIYKGSALNEFKYRFDKDPEKNAKIEANYEVVPRYGQLVLNPPEKKFIITVTLHADGRGNGPQKTLRYDGDPHQADYDVELRIVSESEESDPIPVPEPVPTPVIEPESTSFFDKILSNLGAFFTIKAFAAEPEETAVPLGEIKVTHDGVDFYVRGLYIEGGKGTNAGDYPVYLDYTSMQIFVKDEQDPNKEINVTSDLFKDVPEVVTNLGAGENEAGTEVTAQKKTEEIGCLHILEREIQLISGNARQTYNGKAIYNHDTPAEEHVAIVYPDYPQDFGFVGDDFKKLEITNTTELIGNASTKTSKLNEFTYKWTDANVGINYIITPKFGTLTVDPRPSENDNPPHDDTTPTPPTNPGEVLGAQREQGAVLGARRAGTDDPTNNAARIIVIVIAAGIAVSILFFGKKKEDSEEE